jgi:hypothetical protein
LSAGYVEHYTKDKMNSEKAYSVSEIKQKNVIDMGLTFSAMIRLFEKGSKPKISERLFVEFQKLNKIKTLSEFKSFHNHFCEWFTNNIKTAQREMNGRVIKETSNALYGHAAKLIDVVLKVYVYYSSLPDIHIAETILPFINTAIDNPILNHLKKSFPKEAILSNTVEQIDQSTYDKLQKLIKLDIAKNFNNDIIPTQYDDIMWNRLNRDN